MNNLSKFQVFLFVIIVSFLMVVSMNLLSSNCSSTPSQVETITVERQSEVSALVTISNGIRAEQLYVEVEYPDPDYTNEEVLDELIIEAIDELKLLF